MRLMTLAHRKISRIMKEVQVSEFGSQEFADKRKVGMEDEK